MNIKTGFKSAAFSALMLAAISPASAAVVVDQSNIAVAPNGGSIIYQVFGSPINGNPSGQAAGNFYQATGVQFVTAGLSGLLAAIDLQLTKFGPANNGGNFELIIGNNVTFDTNGFLSGANILGTISGNVSSLSATGGVFNFDTSGLGLSFNAGDQFVLALNAPDGGSGVFGWAAGTSTDAPGVPFNGANFISNNYAGGNAFRRITPVNGADGPFQSHPDFGFRTFVGSVPEPTTWTMMIVGIAGVGFSMRRKGKQTLRVLYT
ncbi:PEPxxWA-CTERM sorting domain-containing protein [Sphingorhabdus sp.]|uniref:PEPxxWA-CTERM sorting domain-containing protein n=1 Tax=Sphingorhabdus sp. TaxID=1902408 RepID=UPI003983AF5C